MKVVALVVTHNHQETIARCLTSLINQKPDRILVVDCDSSDKTLALIRQKFKKVELKPLNRNLGYAAGNNLGIEAALKTDFDQLLILNPDTILEKDCLKKLLFEVETHVQDRILGPKIVQADKKTVWSVGGELDQKRWTAKLIGHGEKDKDQFEQARQVQFISGTCMLLPRSVFEAGLRFYEQYFLYYEDVEFCLKAKKMGFPSYIVPAARIVHYETSSTSSFPSPYKREANPWKEYYLARNHLLFVERNAPISVKLRELARLPKTLLEHSQHKNQKAITGIKDYYQRKFGQYDSH